MSPRMFRMGRAVLASVVAGVGLGAATVYAAEKPNIVLIVADDLGYADVGFHGCRDIPTPNLDRLAASGIRCSNGYVSHSFCAPTRAGLLTGRYQQRFGFENNPAYLPDDETVGLPVGEITIADRLKAAGYVTGLVGKWHQGAAPPFHPMKRGFDEFFGFLGGGHQYFPDTWTGTTEYTTPLEKNGESVAETEYLTDALGREAASFVRRHAAKKPFFLYLAFNAPHGPLQAPDDEIAKFAAIENGKRRIYAAMVAIMDRAIGRVLDEVRSAGVEPNTLICFLSDNGGPTTVNASRNDPLRGNKGQTYEGGIRVPFVISWPALLPGGGVFDHPVISLDLFTTYLAAAGAEVPTDRPIDGVDLLPHLLGRVAGPPHATLFWRQTGSRPWAVRHGRDKLMSTEGADAVPERYDVVTDIGETKNLYRVGGEFEAELLNRYARWSSEMVDPKWEGPRKAAKSKPSRIERR